MHYHVHNNNNKTVKKKKSWRKSSLFNCYHVSKRHFVFVFNCKTSALRLSYRPLLYWGWRFAVLVQQRHNSFLQQSCIWHKNCFVQRCVQRPLNCVYIWVNFREMRCFDTLKLVLCVNALLGNTTSLHRRTTSLHRHNRLYLFPVYLIMNTFALNCLKKGPDYLKPPSLSLGTLNCIDENKNSAVHWEKGPNSPEVTTTKICHAPFWEFDSRCVTVQWSFLATCMQLDAFINKVDHSTS